MRRTDEIASDLVARALLQSDWTCCNCRRRSQRTEVKLLAEDSGEASEGRLVVLCTECRQQDLTDSQLMARSDEWLSLVAWDRIQNISERVLAENAPLALATILAESLRENEEFELLALLYHSWGNHQLRDKYVEKALEINLSLRARIFLRSLQDRLEEVDPALIDSEIERHVANSDWFQLARLQVALYRWEEAVESYCSAVTRALAKGDSFSAAIALREMVRAGLHEHLFEEALRQSADRDQFWWEVRCLEELGWEDDLRDYILSKQLVVERSGDLYLQSLLHQMAGNKERAAELQRKMIEEARFY